MAIKPPHTGEGNGNGNGNGYEDPSGVNCIREVDGLIKYKCQKAKQVVGPQPPSPGGPKKGNIVKIEGFITVSCECKESADLSSLLPDPGAFGPWELDVKADCDKDGWRFVTVTESTNLGPCTDYDDDGTYDNCVGGSGIFIDEEFELPFKAGDVIPGFRSDGGGTGTEADHCGAGISILGFGGRRNASKPISQDVADCMNEKFCSCKKRGVGDGLGGALWPGAGSWGGVHKMQSEQIENMLDKLLRQKIIDEDCRPGGTGSA